MSPFGIPLDDVKINKALDNSYWRVRVCQSTGSTQADLATQIRDGSQSHGSVLVTEYQSAGRGRLDRSFVTPANSALLFSFFVAPKKEDTPNFGWLPLLAGQALFSSLQSGLELTGISLKWPNDILLNKKKVAGILAERIETPNGLGVLLGIGLNVHATGDELVIPTSTSLANEGLENLNRNQILIDFLTTFAKYFERWEMQEQALVNEYMAKTATIGSQIRIENPSGVFVETTAIAVDPTGALKVADGSLITVGDVVHLHSN